MEKELIRKGINQMMLLLDREKNNQTNLNNLI